MQEYIISCCSTVDLSESHLEKIKANYVCFHFSLNGKQYVDDLGKSISPLDFYREIKNGAETKTSQVNVGEFIEYFTPFLKSGKDILHISLSSGISGVYNSALVAKERLQKDFPDRKIYIVDSLCGSSGYGLLVDKAAELKNEGMPIDELYSWISNNKLKIQHWFFSTDLSSYVKGGRISKTSGFLGTMLKICPVLKMDSEGKLVPVTKVRTKEKAIDELVNKMEEKALNGVNYSGKCYICHSACLDDAKLVANKIESKFKHLSGKVLINNIGATIGCHTGPGTIAIFFFGNCR